MFKKLNYEAKVGILVFIAVALLIIGYNWLKGNDLFTKYTHYYTEYKDLQGLTVSSPIRINGYNVGRVSNIDFKAGLHPKIIVRLSIRKGIHIPYNSVARLVNVDVFGTKNIDMVLGDDNKEAKEEDTLKSDTQDDLATSLGKQLLPVKSKTESLVGSIDSLVTSLRSTLSQKTINDIHTSIDHINTSLGHINTITANLTQSTGDINIIIKDVRSITTNIKNNDKLINNTIENLSSISDTLRRAHISEVVTRLNTTLRDLDITMTKINNGDGSLGLLVNDKKLYNNLEAGSKDLDELIKDLKSHPGKLVNLSLFGRKN